MNLVFASVSDLEQRMHAQMDKLMHAHARNAMYRNAMIPVSCILLHRSTNKLLYLVPTRYAVMDHVYEL